jgi:hypothetical protein
MSNQSQTSNNRCFKSYNTILSASERSSEKRKKTIYTEIQNNVKKLNNANPIKKNGFTYNVNTKINPTCDISYGNVGFAASYEMLRDVQQGAELIYPQQISTPKYESWCGNLYLVDYAKYNIQNVARADTLVNIIDPTHVLFTDSCGPIFDNNNKPEKWTYVVDLSFQDTFFAQSANNTINNC